MIFVTAAELRERFNRDRYSERAAAGELAASVRAERHPSPEPAGETFCTMSQIITYTDPSTGARLALAHQYLRPDGTIGASGRPDPKRIWDNGVIYALDPAEGH